MKAAPFRPGDRHHHWELLREVPSTKSHRQVEARCSCGIVKIVNLSSVRAGQSRSCGRCRVSMAGRKHGGWNTSEYTVWSQMKQRCLNVRCKSYYKYGGRGIGVHESWINSFETFLRDVGPRPSMAHTLDRYPDNDGNYELGNVRWATVDQQANNKRPHVWKRLVCLLAGVEAQRVIRMVADGCQDNEIVRHIAITFYTETKNNPLTLDLE